VVRFEGSFEADWRRTREDIGVQKKNLGILKLLARKPGKRSFTC